MTEEFDALVEHALMRGEAPEEALADHAERMRRLAEWKRDMTLIHEPWCAALEGGTCGCGQQLALDMAFKELHQANQDMEATLRRIEALRATR